MKKYLKNIGIKSRIALKELNRIEFKKRNKVLETYIKLLAKNKEELLMKI